MRPRQHGERSQPLRVAIGERPGDAAAPIVADQMKARVAVAAGRDDRHRVVHQAVDVIIGGVRDVGPRARRIAALARRHRAIARVRQRRHLRAPAMHRFRKAMQQQHQRRAGLAGGEGVEGQAGGKRDFFEMGHGRDLRCRAAAAMLFAACRAFDITRALSSAMPNSLMMTARAFASPASRPAEEECMRCNRRRSNGRASRRCRSSRNSRSHDDCRAG